MGPIEEATKTAAEGAKTIINSWGAVGVIIIFIMAFQSAIWWRGNVMADAFRDDIKLQRDCHQNALDKCQDVSREIQKEAAAVINEMAKAQMQQNLILDRLARAIENHYPKQRTGATNESNQDR